MDSEGEGMEVTGEGEEFKLFWVRLPCGLRCHSHCVLWFSEVDTRGQESLEIEFVVCLFLFLSLILKRGIGAVRD